RLIRIETSDGHGSLETKEIGKVRSRPQRSRAAVEATPAEPGFSRDALSHPVSAALMAQPSLHRKTTRCSRTICSNGFVAVLHRSNFGYWADGRAKRQA